MNKQISIRNALPSDLDAVIALDDSVPMDDKQSYWRGVFEHYVNCDNNDRHFLVAEINNRLVGFIIGEVRAWEFGSPPCGWVFTLSVSPQTREIGIGQMMFAEICNSLKRVGVTTVRTMVERDNMLSLSFLRSQGLNTGRYVELEKWLDLRTILTLVCGKENISRGKLRLKTLTMQSKKGWRGVGICPLHPLNMQLRTSARARW